MIGDKEIARRFFDKTELLDHFRGLSREPFIDTLAYVIGFQPTPVALRDFADKHPDRWANALSTLARLSGFHDKVEVENNINITIGKMGDAELEEQLADVQKQLSALTLGPGEYNVEGEKDAEKGPETEVPDPSAD